MNNLCYSDQPLFKSAATHLLLKQSCVRTYVCKGVSGEGDYPWCLVRRLIHILDKGGPSLKLSTGGQQCACDKPWSCICGGSCDAWVAAMGLSLAR